MMSPSSADGPRSSPARPRPRRRLLVGVLVAVGALLASVAAPAVAQAADAVPSGTVTPSSDTFAGADATGTDLFTTTPPEGLVTHVVGDDFEGEPEVTDDPGPSQRLTPQAGGEGYNLFDDSIAAGDQFVIRMAPEVGANSTAALHAATDVIQAETDTEFTFEPWTGTQELNVITVEVSDNSPCGNGGGWLGCGGYYSLGGVIVAGFIYVRPSVETDPAVSEILFHELGHVMGLDHYDALYGGQYQVMRSVGTDQNATTYRPGDLNGIRFMAAATAPVTHDAFGMAEDASPRPSGVNFTGWALDPDTTDPINVQVWVDGVLVSDTPTTVLRSDVNGTYDTTGNHGFDVSVTATPRVEPHQFCLYAVDVQTGDSNPIGCADLPVGGSPLGGFGSATVSGNTVTAKGWAVDPDVASPVRIRLRLDGVAVAGVTADVDRPDIGAKWPGFGDNHGWKAAYRANMGSHQLCAYAVDIGIGSDRLLGCRNFTIGNRNPVGALEIAKSEHGAVRVVGWAVDPDTLSKPIDVHVYVDGAYVKLSSTNVLRNDVNAAQGATGTHGFNFAFKAKLGTRHVCVYAINASFGNTNPLLACRDVVVLA